MSLRVDGNRSMAYQNAGNGRLTWVWKNGNPVFDNGQTERVMSLLVEAPWWADRAGNRRSQLSTVREDNAGTKGRLEQYTLDALEPAITDGTLVDVKPTATREPSGAWRLRINYTTRGGQPGLVDVPLSG